MSTNYTGDAPMNSRTAAMFDPKDIDESNSVSVNWGIRNIDDERENVVSREVFIGPWNSTGIVNSSCTLPPDETPVNILFYDGTIRIENSVGKNPVGRKHSMRSGIGIV